MKQTITIIFILFASSLYSQPWMQIAESKKANPNFYDIQEAFREYEKSFETDKSFSSVGKQPWEEESRIPGFFPYKRWEWFWEPRVYPTGNFPDPNILLTELQNANNESTRQSAAAANWTLMGPINAVPSGGGVGRINCVRFNPLNANTVWAGSPAGGLWKSTNGGTNWTTNTDQLTVLGVTDVTINPVDTTIMYIATGDGDATDTYSAGIMKSTDGGLTWNTTGLTWTASQGRKIGRLLINPLNPAVLIAGSSAGILRTTNAGTSWTTVKTGTYNDLEFMPGNPNIVYAASGGQIFKSSDGGATWSTAIAGGLPTSNVRRIALAVTPANPNVVYALYANSTDDGFLGFYKSSNAGASFTLQSSTPNILGWAQNGSDAGGQGWYDLCVAASPTNENFVLVGGIRIWKSTNGGSTWSISAYNSAHADVHDVTFVNGSGTFAYAGTDGGVYNNPTVTGSNGWTNKSATLQVQQNYKLSNAQTNSAIVVTGSQDNGTNKINGTAMSEILGGDGMDCIVDYTNANIIFGELYYGDIRKSTNGGTNWVSASPANDGAWVTPYVMHPTNHLIMYAGYTTVYKTTDGATTWNGGTNAINTTYRSMAVAPSNGNYVYAASLSQIYRSTDGAITWTNISAGLPIGSISGIAIKYNDPNTLWITFANYSATVKVAKSTNAGASWTIMTAIGLPALPANCIVNEGNNTADALYVGTDIGVYYINNGLTSWVQYSDGLPRVVVSDLEIHTSSAKLRAATFGRGIWQTDLNVGVGITEQPQQMQNNFTVYPNPSQGILNIEVSPDASLYSVILCDVVGKRVKEIESPLLSSGVISMNISDLPNGIYTVLLTDKSETKAVKVSLVR